MVRWYAFIWDDLTCPSSDWLVGWFAVGLNTIGFLSWQAAKVFPEGQHNDTWEKGGDEQLDRKGRIVHVRSSKMVKMVEKIASHFSISSSWIQFETFFGAECEFDSWVTINSLHLATASRGIRPWPRYWKVQATFLQAGSDLSWCINLSAMEDSGSRPRRLMTPPYCPRRCHDSRFK